MLQPEQAGRVFPMQFVAAGRTSRPERSAPGRAARRPLAPDCRGNHAYCVGWQACMHDICKEPGRKSVANASRETSRQAQSTAAFPSVALRCHLAAGQRRTRHRVDTPANASSAKPFALCAGSAFSAVLEVIHRCCVRGVAAPRKLQAPVQCRQALCTCPPRRIPLVPAADLVASATV